MSTKAANFLHLHQRSVDAWDLEDSLRLDCTELSPKDRHVVIQALEAQGHIAELWWSPRTSKWTIRVHTSGGK